MVIACECGAPLLADVTEEGVLPVGGGEIIRFRRTTDYIVCTECLQMYTVTDLIARAQEVVNLLERMADRTEPPD